MDPSDEPNQYNVISPIETLLKNLRKQGVEPGNLGGLGSPELTGNVNPYFGAQQQPTQNSSQFSPGPGQAFSHPFQSRSTNQTPVGRASIYHPATVSSPIVSPPPSGPQPRHASAIVSPNVATPSMASPAPNAGQAESERAANLLSLLKFAQQPTAQRTPSATQAQSQAEASGSRDVNGGRVDSPHQENQKPSGQSFSASDLVASLMRKPGTPVARASAGPAATPLKREESHDAPAAAAPSAAQTQDLLLRLLTQPKSKLEPTQSSQPAARPMPTGVENRDDAANDVAQSLADISLADNSAAESSAKREKQRPKTLRSDEAKTPTAPSKQSTSLNKVPQSMFTYVNPFEQLAASSPRSNAPKTASSQANVVPTYNILKRPGSGTVEPARNDNHKRRSKESSPTSEHASTRRKLTSTNDDAHHGRSSPAAQDAREPSPLAALMGVASATKTSGTVSDALNEVGEQADREVEQVLAKADNEDADDTQKNSGPAQDSHMQDIEAKIRDITAEIQQEREREQADINAALGRTPSASANTAKQPAKETDAGDSDDSSDSSNVEGSGLKPHDGIIRVYQLPMRAYKSMTILPLRRARPTFPPANIIEIARIKKDFDQIDRTLVTASPDYITYAVVKHGGLRVIRQDDGQDKEIFAKTGDRIFNVFSSTGPLSWSSVGGEAVFGTGVSGTVYWAALSVAEKDFWEDEVPESHGFILPPVSGQEDSTAGGQLKTRAKRSSRHPEYFAIGRGKAIYIIWPAVAQSGKYWRDRHQRIVDTDKYLQERCLKISTGKAGKDFVFSEDDTTIVSLDKAGRLKIWDVRKLVKDQYGEVGDGDAAKIQPVDIKTPLMTILTIPPDEKAWPSSVIFIDKHSAWSKGLAMRYLIIGMKQNHTLQLWDLALNKAIQEVNLPHDNESDPICSVCFHTASGTLIVGHPTRNSIYLFSVSTPRYNLEPMSQAAYVEALVNKDPPIPTPDATGIISGMREYSFASKGELRSIDILPVPTSTAAMKESPVLIEMYVMHSKGVSCVSVRMSDLGWGKHCRVKHPVDAEEDGVITIDELRQVTQPASLNEAPTASRNGDVSIEPIATIKSGSKATAKKHDAGADRTTGSVAAKTAPPAANDEQKAESSRAVVSNGVQGPSGNPVEKQDKRRKKRGTPAEILLRGKDDRAGPMLAPSSPSHILQRPKPLDSPAPNNESSANAQEATSSPTKTSLAASALVDLSSINVGVSGDFLDREIKRIEKTMSAEFKRVLHKEIEMLQRRQDEDRRILQAENDRRHHDMLVHVSKTLKDTVLSNLEGIVSQSMQRALVPPLLEKATESIEYSVQGQVTDAIGEFLPKELAAILPDALNRVMHNTRLFQAITDTVANYVGDRVEREFSAALHGLITPAFKELEMELVEKIGYDVERQINLLYVRHQEDEQKLDSLHNLLRGLTQTVSRMAGAQADFQTEILKLQKSMLHAGPGQRDPSVMSGSQQSRNAGESSAAAGKRAVEPPRTPETRDIAIIRNLMREEKYAEATVKVGSDSTSECFLLLKVFVPVASIERKPKGNLRKGLSADRADLFEEVDHPHDPLHRRCRLRV